MPHTLGSTAGLYDHFSPQERLVLLLEAMARGDEAEARRLRSSCPRKDYRGPDAAFDDRFHMAFDITAIVCGDLRSLAGQLHVLHWAIVNMQDCMTLHHINTEMAFMEGVRCGQGLSQSLYFSPELQEHSEPHGRAGESAMTAVNETIALEEQDEGYTQEDLSILGEDFGQRVSAIEERSEKSTELILKVLGRTGLTLATELFSIWEAFGQFSRSRVGLPPERLLEACASPIRAEIEDALKVYSSCQSRCRSGDPVPAGVVRRVGSAFRR